MTKIHNRYNPFRFKKVFPKLLSCLVNQSKIISGITDLP